MNTGIISALGFFFKSLFMPLAFYLFYMYFTDYKSGKRLMTALIIAGIFPLFFTFLQRFFGFVWFHRASRGLMRSVGLYHDIVTPRIFFILTLLGVLIYWHYFLKKEDKIKKILLVIFSSFLLFSLFILYSKAIIITMMLWILMFSFLRKKIFVLPATLLLLLVINFLSNNRILLETHQVFSREITYIQGELEREQVLSGRGMIWSGYISDWFELPVMRKFIGAGVSHTAFHNDYIRLLFSGGILLLISYVILTAFLFSRVFYEYYKKGKFIHFVALLGIVYFFVESIGTVPGLYPSIQTVIWGIAGLSLNQKLEWVENYKSDDKKISFSTQKNMHIMS
jgi:hypothetical protein